MTLLKSETESLIRIKAKSKLCLSSASTLLLECGFGKLKAGHVKNSYHLYDFLCFRLQLLGGPNRGRADRGSNK